MKKPNKEKKLPIRNESVFYQAEHPFAGLSRDEIDDLLVSYGDKCESEYNDLLVELMEVIKSTNPLSVLSLLAAYTLTVGISNDGKLSHPSNELLQPDTEFMQALYLTIPSDKVSSMPIKPYVFQEVIDKLPDLRRAFNDKRYVQIQKVSSLQERAILALVEQIRSTTHVVRNWGHYRQVIKISKELYGSLEEYFIAEIGLGAIAVIDIFDYLVSRIEKGLNEHRKSIKPVFSSKSIKEAVDKYFELFPRMTDTKEQLYNLFIHKKFPLDSVFEILMTHHDLRLTDMYSVSVKDIANDLGLAPEKIKRALSVFSYQSGDLSNKKIEHLFLDNPVWTKPLIQLPGEIFFCAIPQVFFSFALWGLGGIVNSNAKSKKEYEKQRSRYLESKVFQMFKDAFTGCKITKNMKWKVENKSLETDILMKYDSYLFIIEVKSGALTWPALRGASKRVKRHINELFIEPAEQSRRLEDYLLALRQGRASNKDLEEKLGFDLNEVHKIIRVSVTLEDFAFIESSLHKLKDTGYLPDGYRTTTTMSLASLETVFDILDQIPNKLHYFHRRAEIEENMQYVGSELDLLQFYINTGFNIGEEEYSDKTWMLADDKSKIINYYIVSEKEHSIQKPKYQITTWWANIIRLIEKRETKQWTRLAVSLLNISYEEQESINTMLKELSIVVKNKWMEEDHNNTIQLTPPSWRDTVYILLAYCEKNRDKRYLFSNNAMNALSRTNARYGILMGFNIDKSLDEYGFVEFYEKYNQEEAH